VFSWSYLDAVSDGDLAPTAIEAKLREVGTGEIDISLRKPWNDKRQKAWGVDDGPRIVGRRMKCSAGMGMDLRSNPAGRVNQGLPEAGKPSGIEFKASALSAVLWMDEGRNVARR
jgi:hypothetical protein